MLDVWPIRSRKEDREEAKWLRDYEARNATRDRDPEYIRQKAASLAALAARKGRRKQAEPERSAVTAIRNQRRVGRELADFVRFEAQLLAIEPQQTFIAVVFIARADPLLAHGKVNIRRMRGAAKKCRTGQLDKVVGGSYGLAGGTAGHFSCSGSGRRGACLAHQNNVYVVYALVNSVYALFGEYQMPRPEIYPIKKLVKFSTDMLDAIESWRAKQRPIPNVSDAIRQLIEIGLKDR